MVTAAGSPNPEGARHGFAGSKSGWPQAGPSVSKGGTTEMWRTIPLGLSVCVAQRQSRAPGGFDHFRAPHQYRLPSCPAPV